MNQLDRLEKRIRALFETSTAILSGFNANDRIVHDLSIAIQDLFINMIPEDQLVSPILVVNLHPLTLNRWREQIDWEVNLSHLLITTAAEYGTHFHTSPTVQLSADESLAPHEVAIFLKQTTAHPQSETGILAFSNEDLEGENDKNLQSVPLLILKGDKTLKLSGSVINIGRKNTNHIVVNDLRVSRTHAQIRKVKADYVIFDVGSSGGTFINANRIDQHILRPGDVISLAGYTMIFTIDQMPTGETQRNITSEIKSPDKGTDNQ
jgi:hypothetical protein